MNILRSAARAVCLSVVLAIPAAEATAEEPVVILPDDVQWTPVGPAGMEVSVLYGDPQADSQYAMLIKVPQGMKLPPHIHADEWRHSVVLSGTLYFGFGETFDEAAMTAFPPGTFWTETPDAYHFAWAKDGEVVAMLTAMGPTGTTFAAQE